MFIGDGMSVIYFCCRTSYTGLDVKSKDMVRELFYLLKGAGLLWELEFFYFERTYYETIDGLSI